MTKNYRLVMTQGPQPGQVFPFKVNSGPLTLGRDPRNDVVINHPQVSRRHARITRQQDSMVIEDLGSTNGTFVSGNRLTGQYALVSGDVISLGKVVMLAYHEKDEEGEKVVDRPTAVLPQAPIVRQPEESTKPFPSTEALTSKTWLLVGCGCLVLLLIAACIIVFALDHLELLPAFFYEPLRWLGFI